MESEYGLKLNDYFNQLPLFEGLDACQKEAISNIFVNCDYPAFTTLFEQGDPAEYLYLVIEGEVVVNFKPDDGPSITVARVRPGGVVGWSAALGSLAYTSGAHCSEDVRLLRVRGADLRKLCEQNPETGVLILDRLAAVIAQRLSSTHDQVVALLNYGLRNGVHSTGG